jgi:hypothetical protein
MDNVNMESFFGVIGFFFCAICFAIGFKVIVTVAYMGYQAIDLRLHTMAKRVSELNEHHHQPIEINRRVG